MERKTFAAMVVSVLLALVGPASGAEDMLALRIEIHPVATTTLTDQEFLAGKQDGKPVTIAGELRIPAQASGKLPVVVIAHGSAGLWLYEGEREFWLRWLNMQGIATFALDSFTGRGLRYIGDDQARLGHLNMVVDAYRVLEVLARHPRVDAQRIVLIGWSLGGGAALAASMRRFQRLHGPPGIEFAAYISMYGWCHTRYRGDDDITDRPVRLFHGTADDLTPVAPCRAYAERHRRAGKDVELAEYADAHHAFDWRPFSEPMRNDDGQTLRRCVLAETTQGVIVNSETRAAFTYNDPCVERGVTLGYNAKADGASQAAIRSFLLKTFNLASNR